MRSRYVSEVPYAQVKQDYISSTEENWRSSLTKLLDSEVSLSKTTGAQRQKLQNLPIYLVSSKLLREIRKDPVDSPSHNMGSTNYFEGRLGRSSTKSLPEERQKKLIHGYSLIENIYMDIAKRRHVDDATNSEEGDERKFPSSGSENPTGLRDQ